MIYQKETGKVIYRSKMNPGKKRNFEIFDVPEFLALLSCHIPNKGDQMVRYYGFYSNVMRGKRKKLKFFFPLIKARLTFYQFGVKYILV